jgi:hypothetical protein
MRFARQGIEVITKGAIDALHMDGSRVGQELADCRTNLDGKQLSMLIAMLDRLRQVDIGRHLKPRPSPSSGENGLTIRTRENLPIAAPSIAAPV